MADKQRQKFISKEKIKDVSVLYAIAPILEGRSGAKAVTKVMNSHVHQTKMYPARVFYRPVSKMFYIYVE